MNVTRGTSVLTVAMSLEDETVDSFDASKQAAFRESIAAVLEVDASMIELTVRELAPRGMGLVRVGPLEVRGHRHGEGIDGGPRPGATEATHAKLARVSYHQTWHCC